VVIDPGNYMKTLDLEYAEPETYEMEAVPETAPLPAFDRYLMLSSISALPFCYAGTLDIGFPLKFYEVVIFVIFLRHCLRLALRRPAILSLLSEEKRVLALACSFLAVAIAASFFGYFILDKFRAQIYIDTWRHDPSIASTLKCGYLFMDIFFLYFVLGNKSVPVEQICHWWFLGAVLAALYGWYLFVFSVMGHDPILLPGQLKVQKGGPFLPDGIRGGTFNEGNHVSTYYIVSGVLGFAMFVRTWKIWYLLLSLVFFGSLAHTLSTSGFVAGMAFCFLTNVIVGFSERSRMIVAIPLLIFVIFAGIALVSTPLFQQVVVAKLATDSEDDPGGSREQRLDLVTAGFYMYEEYPVLGVGLSNFGYLYPYYTQFGAETLGWDPAAEKNIPNNIYSEVTTETGTIGTLVFSAFCGYMVLLYRKGPRGITQQVMLAGFLSLFVSWLAYPTFSILFQWVFFAVAVKIFLDRETMLPKIFDS